MSSNPGMLASATAGNRDGRAHARQHGVPRGERSRGTDGAPRTRLAALASLLAILLVPGCATIFVTIDQWPDPGVYPGTRADWASIRAEADRNSLGTMTPFFGSIDLLFSLVADTLLLPVHAGLRFGTWLIRGDEEPAKPTEEPHGMPGRA